MKKTVLSILILLVCAGALSAQEISVRGSAWYQLGQQELSYVTPSVLFPSVDLKVGWKLPHDAAYFDAYGQPVGGLGVSYLMVGSMEFPYESRLGDGVSLYGFFTAPIVRSGIFSLEYTIECGGAWLANPYHPVTNRDNHFYGGNLELYLGGTLGARFRFTDRLSLGVEAGFRHISSGTWYVPNKGLTAIAPGVDLKYVISETSRDARRYVIEPGIPEKTFRWGISVGAGAHECDGERRMNEIIYAKGDAPLSFHRYLKANVGLEFFWRYAKCFATGIGLEFLYNGEAKDLQPIDKTLYNEADLVYSPYAGGVILLQEIYCRRFAVHGGVGIDIARRLGRFEDGGLLYQKLGLRYYMPGLDGAFLGFGVRLHKFVQSDYMEITLGKHF